jgi:folate-binding Fe-S cluster repair protein YgfZ
MTIGVTQTEYLAVRDGGAGLLDSLFAWPHSRERSEAVMFLNGLITNDIKSLAESSWMPAAFANVQGRLLAAVRIIHRADGFLIDTEESTREAVMKLIERFTLAGDFKVTDMTGETSELSYRVRQLAKSLNESLASKLTILNVADRKRSICARARDP